MANKLGKFLALTAVIGAAAGAVYYYKSKEAANDDFDDFDDFEDDDVDEELESYLKDEAEQSVQTEKKLRDILPIDISQETVDEAKEALKKAVLDIGDKVVAVAGTVSDTVSNIVKSDSEAEIEEFEFEDLDDDDDIEDFAAEAADVEGTPAEAPASAEAPAEDEFLDEAEETVTEETAKLLNEMSDAE